MSDNNKNAEKGLRVETGRFQRDPNKVQKNSIQPKLKVDQNPSKPKK